MASTTTTTTTTTSQKPAAPAAPAPIPVTTKAATTTTGTTTGTHTYLNNEGQSFNSPQTQQQGNPSGQVGVGTGTNYGGSASNYTNSLGQPIQTVFQNPNGTFSDLYGNPITGAATLAQAQAEFNNGATGVISSTTPGLPSGQTTNAIPTGARSVSASLQYNPTAPPPGIFGGAAPASLSQGLQPSGTGGFGNSQAQGVAVYGPVGVENDVTQTFSNLYEGAQPLVVTENPNGSVSISLRSDFKAPGAQGVLIGAVKGATGNNPYATATQTGPNTFLITPGPGPASSSSASASASNVAPISLAEARAGATTLAAGLNQPGVSSSDIVYGNTVTTAVNRPNFAAIDSSFGFLSGAPVLGPTTPTSSPNQIIVNPGSSGQTVLAGFGTPQTGVTYRQYNGLISSSNPDSITYSPGLPNYAPTENLATGKISAGPASVPVVTTVSGTPATVEPGGTLTGLSPVLVFTPPGQGGPITPTEQFAHVTAANPNPFSPVKFVVLPPVVAAENANIAHSGLANYGTPQNTFDTYLQQVGNTAYLNTNPGQPGAENAVKDIGTGLAIGTVITGARILNLAGQDVNLLNPFSRPTPAQARETGESAIAVGATLAPLVIAPLVIGALGAGVATVAGAGAANTLGIGLELGFAGLTGAQVGTIKDKEGRSYIDPGRFLVGAAIPIGIGEGLPLLEGKPGPLTSALSPKPIGEPAVLINVQPSTYIKQEGEFPLEGETAQTGSVNTQAQFDISGRQLYGYKVPNFISTLLGSNEPGVAFPSYQTATYSQPIEQVGTLTNFEANKASVTTSPGYLEPTTSNPEGEAAPLLVKSETNVQLKNVGLPAPTLASLQASTVNGPYAENVLPPVLPSAGETVPTPADLANLQGTEQQYSSNIPVKTTFGPRSFTFGQGSEYYQIQPTVEEALNGIPQVNFATGVNKALNGISGVEYPSASATETVQLSAEAPSTAQGPVVSSFRSLTLQEGAGVGGERALTAVRTQPEYTLLYQQPNEQGGTLNVYEQSYQGTLPSTLAPTRGALTNIEGSLTVDTLKPAGAPTPLLPSDVYPSGSTGNGPNIEIFGPPTVGSGTGGAPSSGGTGQFAGGFSEQPSSGGTSVAQRFPTPSAPNVLPDISGAQARGESAISAQLQTPAPPTTTAASLSLGAQGATLASQEELTLPGQTLGQQGDQRSVTSELTVNGLKILPIVVPNVNTLTGQKSGTRTGQGGQTNNGQRTGTGGVTDSGFRIGGGTDTGQRGDVGQRQGQGSAQAPQQAQLTSQVTIPALPPVVETGARPPTPPPPIPPPNQPVGIPVPGQLSTLGASYSPEEGGLFESKAKRRPAGVLPDIFSASASEARFGSATAGFLENTPELGGRASALSGTVPTLEELRYEKGKGRAPAKAARPSVGVKGADFSKGGFKLKF